MRAAVKDALFGRQRVAQRAAQRKLSEQRSTEKDDSIFLRVVQAKTVAASRHWMHGCYLQCFQTQMHERTDLVELIEGFPEKKEQIAQRENSAEFVTSPEVFVDTAKNVPCKY